MTKRYIADPKTFFQGVGPATVSKVLTLHGIFCGEPTLRRSLSREDVLNVRSAGLRKMHDFNACVKHTQLEN